MCMYVITIRFDSLSLITPAFFFLVVSSVVRMSRQPNSSIVVKFRACRFFIRQMKKNWLRFCCFFAVFLWMAPTVDVMFLPLPRWEFWMSCTCCKANWDSMRWLEVPVWEHLTSIWSFHQFRTSLDRRMSLSGPTVSVEENLRKVHSSLWTGHAWPGWVLYHGVSLTQCETHMWCLAAIQ